MKYMIAAGIAVALLIATACGKDKVKSKNVLCKQKYVLCTSAPCIPDPKNPSKSVCQCVVHEGLSFGNTPCSARAAKTDRYGVTTVASTYSLEQFGIHKNMRCPDGKPWSNCLDKPCTIDPMDPSKAICFCDVLHKGAFLTLGGNCNTTTCDTGYWSGATLESYKEGTAVLAKALGLKKPPENMCPAN